MVRFNPVAVYIALILLAIVAVEFSTPPEYILGYLYVGPILLSNWFLSRRATAWVTGGSVVLTLANLIVPGFDPPSSIALVDRLITVAALLTVAFLAASYRHIQEESLHQRARIETQEQLAQVRADFIATLTHDLRTPLLGTQSTLAFFKDGQFGPTTAGQQEVLAVLQKSNSQQLAMVEMLLSIYRNDERGLVLERHFIDLDELCAEQLTLLQDLAMSRQIDLRYEGIEGARLAVDGMQLGRVVANLVSNAIKHTPREGEVVVRLLHRPREYCLLVEDTGSGIAEADLSRIFERFYQSDGTRDVPGTGLGLYLSRQIVEAHGGQIWAENRSTGGCTFGVSLPVASQAAVSVV
ncbi:sensor histidine kinase [Gloeobacter kilaueensis]|uniref:histidine kinase n=1 Tax=Gloeobacter kilaueensis (strain ATCC BAA-2537 / CCAP 1431/1 / ULC 316 / JS1) TaxID=1183438 RepID=U5QJ11_GLOK1|nr:HAMP domain-containing sensor histidine kinase [Gloeobacter kilaueensis]AGY58967.1 multi-sensor signal transduction histidine kinase [Gloeobacter kilaueensis JS1]